MTRDHRRTEGRGEGGDGPSAPPFWGILLGISKREYIFFIFAPPLFEFLYALPGNNKVKWFLTKFKNNLQGV